MDNLLHPKKEKGKENKRSDSKDRERGGEKRHSLLGGKPKSVSNSPRLAPTHPGKFEIIIESPPLIFYGPTSNSSGALLSGRIKLNVQDPTGEVRLENFNMVFRAIISTKKPVVKDCDECRTRFETLKTWSMLSEPKTFKNGEGNEVPFSYLLPGHMAATTSATLGSIKYELMATAKTSHGETIDISHPIKVQRAIPTGNDKTSIRIFPPTNLTGRVVLPPYVHPIGKFNVQMTLSGVVENKSNTTSRWRLRKMMWRIEEQCKMTSAPCKKHLSKIPNDGKAIQHTEVKPVGHDEMKSGWKTDFDTIGGEILLDFEAALSTKVYHDPVCDVDSAAGLQVSHNLIVELIVAEEFVSTRNPSIITPTGAARVLRMQFGIVVTERGGMGISWDEEMPPMYDDVPDSPPRYPSADEAGAGATIEDYHGPELEYVDLERMHTEDPNDPPVYRERDPATINNGPALRTVGGTSNSMVSAHDAAGPSGTRRVAGRWTEDELGAEPPQYALRGREPSDSSQQGPEDVGVGETA